METRILLLRHGQSDANVGKFFSGSMNVALTELGKKQAELAAMSLKDIHLDAVISSPLDRAIDTALPFAKMRGLEVEVIAELTEWNAGDWEGMRFDDIVKSYPEEHYFWTNDIKNLTMPNGESAHEVRERFGKALDKVARMYGGKVVIIACHGGVIKTVPSYYAGCDGEVLNATPVPGNCSITEVMYKNGVGEVVRYSDESHLGSLKSEAFII